MTNKPDGQSPPNPAESPCCCGSAQNPKTVCCADPPLSGSGPDKAEIEPPFVIGRIPTPAGDIPRVSTELTFADRLGGLKVRWGIARMRYAVAPGLYAVGEPDANSDVLVTANYKLTFDTLRSDLAGRNLWLLVLNTAGVNVWCAAGKGTFGTCELVSRIEAVGLDRVVSHRRLVAPQLGAPGIAAHTVKEQSGFKVVYGPIRSRDLPAFLDAGKKATSQMRRKDFPLSERLAVIPIELVTALKFAAILSALFLFASGLGGSGGYWSQVSRSGLLAVSCLLGAVLSGAVLTPVLLPWLPGRAFSQKSLLPGLALTAFAIAWFSDGAADGPNLLEAGAWLLIAPALAAFAAMNFTGASTYTSLSGVKKEMRIAVPVEIGAFALGLALWIAARATA